MRIVEVELPFRQNPQCHVVTLHQRDQAMAVFDCWDDDADIAPGVLGCVRFYGVLAVKVERHSARLIPDELEFGSSLYQVLESDWLHAHLQAVRAWTHDDHGADRYRHYLVNSHDHQLAVLCTGYDAQLLQTRLADIIGDFEFG